MAKKATRKRTPKTDAPPATTEADLPSLPEVTAVATEPEPEAVEASVDLDDEPAPVTIAVEREVVTVKVPKLIGVEGYARRRVDVKLSGSQALKLKQIQQGLEDEEKELADGRRVSTPFHAVLWMIEQA